MECRWIVFRLWIYYLYFKMCTAVCFISTSGETFKGSCVPEIFKELCQSPQILSPDRNICEFQDYCCYNQNNPIATLPPAATDISIPDELITTTESITTGATITTTIPGVTTTTDSTITTTIPGVTTTTDSTITTTIPGVTTTTDSTITTTIPGVTTTTDSTITTTIPGVTTTIPVVTTTIPGVTTTIPVITTTIPGVTTTIPGVTTTIPGVTTTTDSTITTTIPGVTTTIPGVTTTIPGSTIAPSENSTTDSVITTSIPGLQCGKLMSISGSITAGRRHRILGGLKSKISERCWQVAVINSKTRTLIGGGSLIGSQWVLTSAHKMIETESSKLVFRVGADDLVNVAQPCAEDKKASKVFLHPLFQILTDSLMVNNAALVKLDSPVNLNSGCTCLICLPMRGQNFENKTCAVSGYGLDETLRPSGLLKSLEVKVTTDIECAKNITSVYPRFMMVYNHLCAGGEEGKDACWGDGGGPLACKDEFNTYYQAGIVSSGVGCGTKGLPAIYSKVEVVKQWIDSTLATN